MKSHAPKPLFKYKQKIQLLQIGIVGFSIPTYTTGDELLKLHSLAKTLGKNAVAVEIGSYMGASSLLIAKGLQKNSKLYCVDTWQNDAMSEGNWDSFEEFTKNVNSVSKKIIPVRKKSIEAASDFKTMVDFIFIDGDHSYEGVKQDVGHWFKFLKPGGIIVMHDIGWAEGVNKVIKEDIDPYVSKSETLPNMYWAWKK